MGILRGEKQDLSNAATKSPRHQGALAPLPLRPCAFAVNCFVFQDSFVPLHLPHKYADIFSYYG